MISLVLIVILIPKINCENSLVNSNSFEVKIGDIFWSITKFFEGFNDRFIGESEWGKTLGYDEMKPAFVEDGSRGMKKMSMAMMPLIFHVGATSTWMMITSIMAVKSVAIGVLLLIFKIAMSSAKIASFFTMLKSKTVDHHHDHWSPHGYERSLYITNIPVHEDHSYEPDWTPSDPHTGYKTIPTYKENDISSYEEYEHSKLGHKAPHI